MDLRDIRIVAARGLFGLGEAVLGFARNDRARPLLRAAWGPLPALGLGLAAIASGLFGVAVGAMVPSFVFVTPAIWPVLLFSAFAAWRIRRVLRARHAEALAAPGRSLRALAAPLVPATFVLVLVTSFAPHVLPQGVPGAAETVDLIARTPGQIAGLVFSVLLSWLAHGAGVAVCTATLAGRREWLGSLVEIGWRYFVFKIMLWVTLFVAGIASGVLWKMAVGVLRRLVDWRLPEAWRAVFEQGVEAGIAALVFLAFIGSAWLAAEQCFPRLLRTGDVHVLHAMGSMFDDEDEPPEESVDPTWPGVPPQPPPPPPTDEAGEAAS